MTEENTPLQTEETEKTEEVLITNTASLPEEFQSMSHEDIVDALLTTPQPAANSLQESAEELKAMGFRDISEFDEKGFMAEAMKNIQIQKMLKDVGRGTSDRRSPREYLEQHIEFLTRISPGKTKKDIVSKLTLEHAREILKITAKMELPDAVIKKHLRTFNKKYS